MHCSVEGTFDYIVNRKHVRRHMKDVKSSSISFTFKPYQSHTIKERSYKI